MKYLAVTIVALLAVMGVGLISANWMAPNAYPPPQLQVVDLSELKTEVLTDPLALGYAGKTNYQIAQLMNTVGLSGEVVGVAYVTADIVQSQVVATEYLTLTASERALWAAVLAAGSNNPGIPVANTNIRGQITAIWGAGTTTRTNLGALQTRSGSRAEALWGDGASVTDHDIEKSLLLP